VSNTFFQFSIFQEIIDMKTIKHALTGLALSSMLAFTNVSAIAAPTEATSGGATSVLLAPSFLSALTSLGVAPGPIEPGRIASRKAGVIAAFPITAGEIDLGTVKGEIDHAGGLSLTAGATKVELTTFVIDLTGTAPVLTGLVIVNDNLVGRLPLFDLSLTASKVSAKERQLKVNNVVVTLTDEAAQALNGVFNINALSKGVAIGTAKVRANLGQYYED
jgi:hypothetical protein